MIIVNKLVARMGIISLIILSTVISGCISDDGDDTPEPADHAELSKTFLSLLFGEQSQSAWEMFNQPMKNALPAVALDELVDGIVTLKGMFVSYESEEQTSEGEYEIVLVTCVFENGESLVFRIVFDSEYAIAGFFLDTPLTEGYSPPDYADESLFTESNVSIGHPDWELPAVVTMPKGTGPFPAVVLVHGSGSSDMDVTIGDNKPFKDIAWGLASQGIAVIRYDKRTYVYGEEMAAIISSITLEDETIDDAVAAVKFIASLDGIDSTKVVVIGHSLGGYACPLIAQASGELDGFISLAGGARHLEDVIIEQTEYLANLDGTVDDNEAASLLAIEAISEKIRTLDIAADEIVFGAGRAYWEFLSTYEPVDTASELDMPMLFLQGERDYQATMTDFGLWKDGLAEKGEFISYPGLNHLMFYGAVPSDPNEYYIESHVESQVIVDIAQWLQGL